MLVGYYRLAALLAVYVLIAVGCAAGPSRAPEGLPAESPFTGLPGGTGRPVLAVKIDNAVPARPPTGVAEADLVYLEPVEGGVTRLLAIYSSRLPRTLGPVRSVRESDLTLLRQFGRPALIFSGEAPELLPALRQAPLVPLSPAEVGQAFVRDPRRPAPFNLYARTGPLLAAAGRAGVPADIGFRFGPAPPGGAAVPEQVVRFERATFTAQWSPPESRWLVSMDDAPLRSVDGNRLGATTVVVQFVPIRPSTIRDTSGAVSPYVETLGGGTALVLRDGLAYDARWSRPTPSSGTTFTTPDGAALPFARGPVWVVLAPA